MNKITLLAFITLGAIANAQTGIIGINTPTPSAALDIVSKGTDGSTKALEINNSVAKEMVTVLDNSNVGIGIPNPLYNLEIGDFLNDGAYLSLSQSGSNANGQTSLTYFSKRTGNNSLTNTTSKGFKWFTLSDSYANTSLANSLFLESWSSDNPAITGLSTNRLSNIMVINPKGNVGFGTQLPTARVHIDATVDASGGKGIGTGFRLVDGSQGAGKVLVSDANGYAKWEVQSGSGASTEPWNEAGTTNPAISNNQNIYQKGYVGIGHSNPNAPLTIGSGDGNFPGQILVNPQNTSDEGGEIILAASPSSSKRWIMDQVNWFGGGAFRIWSQHKSNFAADGKQFTIRENGSVGINEANPQDFLHIRGIPASLGPVGGVLINNNEDPTYSRIAQGNIALDRQSAFASHVGGYIDFYGGQSGSGSGFRVGKTHVPGVIDALTINVNGVSDVNAFNFYAHTNGQVSIGTSALFAGFKLNVGGSIAAQGFSTRHGIYGASTGNSFNIPWDGTHAGVWIDNTFLGNFSYTSDYRLKKNVNTITTNALSRVMQLRPVNYEYKDIQGDLFKSDNKVHEGFIAHELQAVIADAVNGEKDALTNDGKIQPQTINPVPIISLLTKAIQEQQDQIAELKHRIEQLERQ